MNLSIIIPAYNSRQFVAETISKLTSSFPEAEIIVVNDGSKDETLDILLQYKSQIKIVTYKKNRGKGYALRKGFEIATKDVVIFTDADLPYPVEKIQEILTEFQQNTTLDIVVATRQTFNEFGFRKLTHECCILGTNALFWLGIKDTQCGLKGFKKCFIDKISPCLKSNNFTIDVEILHLAKITNSKIKTIDVVHSKQETTTIKIFDILRMGFELLKIRLSNYKKCLKIKK